MPRSLARITMLTLGILLFSACKLDHSNQSSGPHLDAQAKMANRDVKVPRELISQIEQWFITSERRRDATRAGTDLEVLGTLKRRLMNFQVELTPKSGNALEQGLRFKLPTGGGTIDLADFVPGTRGSFWVKMVISKEIVDLSDMKVFFLSESRKRTVLGEELGSGCGKLAEMTTWFTHDHANKALAVYVADQRYVSLLAGTWLFAAIAKNELHLGTISFTDSRYPFLLCQSEAL